MSCLEGSMFMHGEEEAVWHIVRDVEGDVLEEDVIWHWSRLERSSPSIIVVEELPLLDGKAGMGNGFN